MKIKQYKEFKEEFIFISPIDENVKLRKIRKHTFNREVLLLCTNIGGRLLNSNRPKRDIENSILLSYILYLCEFTKGYHENFDKIFTWIVKDTSVYVNETTLKEILKNA